MKYSIEAKEFTSEGKLLEVIPVITDDNGQPFMLPPVTWQVPNWLLGFNNDHAVRMPQQFYMGERISIPGSYSSRSSSLSFLIRVLEDSPSSGVSIATVDTAAVTALIDAIRHSVNQYRV